ncbi:hypothetical protein ACOMHN_011544 [Nucella lapillus]
MYRETSSRPERRTALIAKELSRYNIDIAALSKTRLADEGPVAEPKGGYTFWKGKDQDEEIRKNPWDRFGNQVQTSPTTTRPPYRHQRATDEALLPTEYLPKYHGHQCMWPNTDQQR